MSKSNQVPRKLDGFREVVLIDTEFIANDGERVVPVCMVAIELRSGQMHRVFFDNNGGGSENPLPYGDDVLYVAYSAPAEWSVFLALGWELPENILDLFAEYRAIRNGLVNINGTPVEYKLISALEYFGLDSMTVAEKSAMIERIQQGYNLSFMDQCEILDYCEQDVLALKRLLPAMLPEIDLPYASFRGRYTKAVARMEYSGIPINTEVLDRLQQWWPDLKATLADDLERTHGFGVYEGTSWSNERFGQLLSRLGILDEWPRTEEGLLSTCDDDVFKPMAQRYPVLEPLRDVRTTLTRLRELGLTVGSDGRNRFPIMPFRSITGRNYPPSSKFIFGPSTWLRSLIQPEEGRAIAYVDWVSAEFGIAAALSGDSRMKDAYKTGDVYMAFAIDAGAAPKGSTNDSHPEVRDLYKVIVLATQYGQGANGVAKRLGIPVWRAQSLLDLHRKLYARFWEWSEWMSQSANFSRKIETVFRWPMRLHAKTKATTVGNFPMQAHGAEMLRWACCFATEIGIEVHAPVQDALLVGGTSDQIEDVVAATQKAMAQASDLVLDGFTLQTDVKIVRYPDRYVDKRGKAMWERVMRSLDEMEPRELQETCLAVSGEKA